MSFSDDKTMESLQSVSSGEVEVKSCDCPCHEGKVAPHDEYVCPQCGEWKN